MYYMSVKIIKNVIITFFIGTYILGTYIFLQGHTFLGTYIFWDIQKYKKSYNNKLLLRIKENFTETQQQLFVSSFYCYLNYNQTNDFVIDLDNIWKWLGFAQKVNAKTLLEKNFVIEKDYKCSLLLQQKQKKEGRGGNNKETIMLNIKTNMIV